MVSRVGRASRIEIAPRTVLLVGGLLAGAWLLRQLWGVAILVLVALMLVGTLSPLVSAVQRRGVGRTGALLIVFTALLGALSLVLLVTVPPLIGQVMDLLANAPGRRDELVAWLEGNELLAPLAGPVRNAGLERVTTAAGDRMLAYSSMVITAVGYGITAVFLAFYLLADGARARGTLFAVVPRSHHVRLARILLQLEQIVGGYVRGQLFTSGAMFVFTFVLLTILGVPNALSLSVFAALVDVIPFVGGILATAPAVIMALPLGSGVVIALLVAMFIYQEFESRLLVPRVYGRVLRLSPAAVLVALLVGGTLFGIIGALLALPVTAGVRMIAQELRVELPGDDSSEDPAVRAVREAAERRYHHESAGAAPEAAAQVAAAVALDIDRARAQGKSVPAVVVVTDDAPSDDQSGPSVVAVDRSTGEIATLASRVVTAPVLAAVSSSALTLPPKPGRPGAGAGDRRADRSDPAPRRCDRRRGSWARPTGRRH